MHQKARSLRKGQGFSVWSKTEFPCMKPLPSAELDKNKRDKQLLICPQCFYTTFVPQSMANHEKTHTGERPYQCDHCKRGFIYKGSLRRHLKSRCNRPSHKNSKREIKKLHV